MTRVLALLAGVWLALAHLVAPPAGTAQPAGRVARIGILGPAPSDPLVEAFRQGLHELGYVEGQNIRIEFRDAAADLVRLNVDVIVASSQRAVAARQATTTIPIVMPIITDPVRLGLVASLGRPGGNATGLATQNDELPGKWIELAREAIPSVTRVAIFFHPTYDGGVQLKASEGAARSLGVRLQAVNVETAEDLTTAFSELRRNRPDALIVSSSPLFYTNRTHRGVRGHATAADDLPPRRVRGGVGWYVDKILKGARPGDLPVQRPTKFELVIDRRAAKALGLSIPPPLLLRADRLVE